MKAYSIWWWDHRNAGTVDGKAVLYGTRDTTSKTINNETTKVFIFTYRSKIGNKIKAKTWWLEDKQFREKYKKPKPRTQAWKLESNYVYYRSPSNRLNSNPINQQKKAKLEYQID